MVSPRAESRCFIAETSTFPLVNTYGSASGSSFPFATCREKGAGVGGGLISMIFAIESGGGSPLRTDTEAAICSLLLTNDLRPRLCFSKKLALQVNNIAKKSSLALKKGAKKTKQKTVT